MLRLYMSVYKVTNKDQKTYQILVFYSAGHSCGA